MSDLPLCHEEKKQFEISYTVCTVQLVDWAGPGVAYTVYTHQQYSAIKTQAPSENIFTVQLWECEAARTKTNGILKIEKLYKRDLCFRYTLPRLSGKFLRTVGLGS